MPVEILQTQKLLPTCEQALAERYTVHKLHEAADRDELLARVGKSVRGVACGVADAALIERLPNLEIIAHFGVAMTPSIRTQRRRAGLPSPTRRTC